MQFCPLPTVLVIDDSAECLTVLTTLLQPEYRVLAAVGGAEGLRVARSGPPPDLILLDVVMPTMDGYEVLRRLRDTPSTRSTPVIFLTSLGDADAEEEGLALGAADYVTKPPRPAVLLARMRVQIEVKLARDILRDQNSRLEAEVSRRMAENDLTQRAAIHALAHLAETRDPETGDHLLRTQGYVQRLALELRTNPRYTAALTDRFIALLTRSAPLHDIGKVSIPDPILLKPGPLSPEEWVVMKTHARAGWEAIDRAERDIEEPLEFLSVAKEIARWHHERWDGTGYPDGLVGEAIPISARLMAVADVFDALTTPRVYKPAMPCAAAREVIVAGRGRHFDPAVVDAFLAVFDAFVKIAALYDEVVHPGRPGLAVAGGAPAGAPIAR